MEGGSPPRADVAIEFVLERSGGLCPSPDGGGAVCRLTVVVTDHGAWNAGGSPPPGTGDGSLPVGSASRLAAIFDGGWEALTAQRFTGTCPTAYDGQEVSYTVRRLPRGSAAPFADADIREVTSCTYDLSHPGAQAVIGDLNQLWRSLELPG